MKWSKTKASVLASIATLLVTAVVFAGPFKDRAGRLFDWWLGGVKQMELYDGQLRVDKISNIAMDAAPDFPDGLNLSSEPTLVAEYMTATTATGSPAAGKFYSAIVGRQPMLDLSKVPSGKHGVERVMTNQISLVSGETTPSGGSVWATDDPRARFYGGLAQAKNDASGQYILIQEAGGSFEVVFYGTGLNVLVGNANTIDRGFTPTVDGVVGSFISALGSNILDDRNYSVNVIRNVASELTLGVHTVSITKTTFDIFLSGFEILNEATTVAIPAGSIVDNGRKYTATATTDDLTTFENEYQDGSASGSSTKGGHQVRYFDTDGTIKKDINYADSTQLNLAAASHVNSGVVQKINWRDFGAGRADDFSTLTTVQSDRSFTLDDGTTTLAGDNVAARTGTNTLNSFTINVAAGSFTLTFVGTGLDAVLESGSGGPIAELHTITVDGSSVGTNYIFGGGIAPTTQGIVSGLPFGTHTVKVEVTNTAGADVAWSSFLIYAPKKPVLTAGQVEIDSTYKLADYVANTTAGFETIATGVLRKYATREIVYGGSTWVANIDMGSRIGGWGLQTDTNADSFSYTFIGTGFDHRQLAHPNSDTATQVSLTSDALGTITNFAPYTTGVAGTHSFTAATGVLNSLSNPAVFGAGTHISGLPYDLYTVNFAKVAGTTMRVEAMDIIVPTYSYKNNLLNLDDAIVGSNSLKNEILVPGATKHKIIATAGIEMPAKVHLRYALSSNATHTNNTVFTPTLDLVQHDNTHGSAWSALGHFVAPRTAYYNFAVAFKYTDLFDIIDSGGIQASIFYTKNGDVGYDKYVLTPSNAGVQRVGMSDSKTFYLQKGDNLQIRVFTNIGNGGGPGSLTIRGPGDGVGMTVSVDEW